MTNTEHRIAKASKVLGKAVTKLKADDLEMANRIAAVLEREMQAVREGR